MRLTIAVAALLSQVLPASTEVLTSDIQHNVIIKSVESSGKNLGGIHWTLAKSSTIQDPGKRIFKNAAIYPNRLQIDDTLLKNKYSHDWEQTNSIKECDPKSEDPDVGILSCGAGQYCKEQKDLTFGGVCAAIATTRELSGSGLYYYFCKNSNQTLTCDCSNVDATTQAGVIRCFEAYHCVGCPEYCFTYNSTIVLSTGDTLSTFSDYIDAKKPYQLKFHYYLNYSNGECVYTINGVNCTSCNTSYFDCTNIPKGLKGENTAGSYALPVLIAYNSLSNYETCAPGNGSSTAPPNNTNGPSMPPPNDNSTTTMESIGPNQTTNPKSGTQSQHSDLGYVLGFAVCYGMAAWIVEL